MARVDVEATSTSSAFDTFAVHISRLASIAMSSDGTIVASLYSLALGTRALTVEQALALTTTCLSLQPPSKGGPEPTLATGTQSSKKTASAWSPTCAPTTNSLATL